MDSQYNDYRKIYIDNILSREYPVLPAYYYYLNHTQSKDILNIKDFQEMFINGCSETYNLISLETKEPYIDLEKLYSILDSYYDVNYLLTKDGQLLRPY